MAEFDIVEKFKSLQGEGVYTGVPMAFIRFVGCSVGKKICHHCDTDFDNSLPWRGGGRFSVVDLYNWARPYNHICLTGGEPLNQDLAEFFLRRPADATLHIETSGTVPLEPVIQTARDMGLVLREYLWICLSPKPGFLEENIRFADEIKVIVPGLGNGPGWPTLDDAVRWADAGKKVFLQPRNKKNEIDQMSLKYVLDILREQPNLRLSVQLHKVLKEQ